MQAEARFRCTKTRPWSSPDFSLAANPALPKDKSQSFTSSSLLASGAVNPHQRSSSSTVDSAGNLMEAQLEASLGADWRNQLAARSRASMPTMQANAAHFDQDYFRLSFDTTAVTADRHGSATSRTDLTDKAGTSSGLSASTRASLSATIGATGGAAVADVSTTAALPLDAGEAAAPIAAATSIEGSLARRSASLPAQNSSRPSAPEVLSDAHAAVSSTDGGEPPLPSSARNSSASAALHHRPTTTFVPLGNVPLCALPVALDRDAPSPRWSQRTHSRSKSQDDPLAGLRFDPTKPYNSISSASSGGRAATVERQSMFDLHFKVVDPESFANLQKISRVENAFYGPPLHSPGRVYLREGALLKIGRTGKPSMKMFFLFNDILVYGTPLPFPIDGQFARQLQQQRRLDLKGMTVRPLQDETGFVVYTPSKSFELRAASAQERDEWIVALVQAVPRQGPELRLKKSATQSSAVTSPAGTVQRSSFGEEEDPLASAGTPGSGTRSSKEGIASIHGSSELAPVWIPDGEATLCMSCQSSRFGMLNRRHHCRHCGEVVCGACSEGRRILPNIAAKPVRVCRRCDDELARKEAFERAKALA